MPMSGIKRRECIISPRKVLRNAELIVPFAFSDPLPRHLKRAAAVEPLQPPAFLNALTAYALDFRVKLAAIAVMMAATLTPASV